MAISKGYFITCSFSLISPFHHKHFSIQNVYVTACTAVQNISLADQAEEEEKRRLFTCKCMLNSAPDGEYPKGTASFLR